MSATSFIDALEEKYAGSDVSASENMFVLNNMDVAGAKGTVRVPREMSLHRLGVSHAGDPARITEICSKVTSLDVTNNMLTDWKEIFTILSCVPKVTFLNLSENQLTQSLPETADVIFPHITSLALNSTTIPIDILDCILLIMPSVAELHLCMNEYSSVTFHRQHPSVTSLFMNANKFTDFNEILKLSHAFPNISQLLILQNPLSCLPEAERLQSAFPNMECLNISETEISSWSELEKLKHFPLLTDVRMKDLPLFKETEENLRRQLVISFLPGITKLNLSAISTDERVAAERMFIRHFAEQENKPDRWQELVEVHGPLGPLVQLDLKPASRCTVEIHMGGNVTTRTVDIRQTVQEFKKLLATEIVKLPPSKFSLLFGSLRSNYGAEDLKIYKVRPLYTMLVEDGDRFYIHIK